MQRCPHKRPGRKHGSTCPTKSFLGAMAGSGGSPGRIFFGFANATTRGRLPAPCSRVRPSWASIAASAAEHQISLVSWAGKAARWAGDLRLSDSVSNARRARLLSDPGPRVLRSAPLQRSNRSGYAALDASDELQMGTGLATWDAREPSPACAAISKGTSGSAAAGRTPIARDRTEASTAMVRARGSAASRVSSTIMANHRSVLRRWMVPETPHRSTGLRKWSGHRKDAP